MTPLRVYGTVPGLLLVLILALPGCIGIVGIGKQERKSNFSSRRPFDAKSYELRRGKPDRIEVVGDGNGKEIWTYQLGGLRWRGIVLLVIIPIPLIVPIGHEDMTLVVEQGRIVSITERESEFTWGALCGFIWHPHSSDATGFHCGMWPWPGDS